MHTSINLLSLTMLLCINISASLGRLLVPRNILEVNVTFKDLFISIQAGCFDNVAVSDDLKSAKLVRLFVGRK